MTDLDKPHATSFRNEVIAALNVGGCNAGACHGTPSGKNGFKLSLRGFDPAADYLQLTRDVLGRRTDRQQPDASLILQKGLGRVPHEGGQRFLPDSVPVRALRDWLAEGLRDDPPTAAARQEHRHSARLPRATGARSLAAIGGAWAISRDGSVRDVTRLTVFSSSDPAVADVSSTGLVEFNQAGEVAILCRYLMELQTVRLTYLEPRQGFVWPNPPENNYVDKYVFAKLKMLSIPPSEPMHRSGVHPPGLPRRVRLLPTPKEVREFLADTTPNKRAKLIDALLERPEYADFWTLKWSDVFRSSRKAIQVKGTHVFQHWLRDHIAQQRRFRRDGPRDADGQRQHLRQSAGQLLPHRPRSAEPGRDDGAAVLRHPHAVLQVPQSSVRALDAGRLLQHGRVLRPRPAQERSARTGRRSAEKDRSARSSTMAAPAR